MLYRPPSVQVPWVPKLQKGVKDSVIKVPAMRKDGSIFSETLTFLSDKLKEDLSFVLSFR